ncbi:MAG: oxidoreductase [Chloroflexota bacterium]|nr:oxidoreductase [Chloroflexota bacterium]
MVILPLGILWFGAVVVSALDGTRRAVGLLAASVVGASLFSMIVVGVNVVRNGPLQMVAGGWVPGVGITLRLDALGVTFAVLSLGVLLAALLFETLAGVRTRLFPALVLFMAVGLTGLFTTGDAFNFYVFFEISMVSAYILASYGGQPRQLRAAIIFAVVNLLGSVLFLIGIAAVYHITGRLDMIGISAAMPLVAENPATLTATIIFIAFGIKLGLFPFHFWLPAVYTGTTPAVAAILSGALANIGSYGLIRFGAELFPRELTEAAGVLLVLASASILYGAIQAISRRSPLEVLAYSAIGQVGYILAALAVGGEAGYAAAVLYAVVNGLNKTLLFLAANVRGWLIGVAFAVGAFSVAGVPPAAGFLGKLALFRVGAADARWWLVALIVLGGALSFLYMFQLYGERFWADEGGDRSPTAARVLVGAIALAVVALGAWPEPLIALSEHAARSLPERAP